MKNSLITDIALYGKYVEKFSKLDNKQYNEYADKVDELIKKLCNNLPKEESSQIIWELNLAQSEKEIETAEEHFREGFKLGLIIGAQNFLE